MRSRARPEPGRMSKEVAHGRARRTSGLIEVDRSLLDRNKGHQSRGELREGRPGERTADLPPLGRFAALPDDARRRVLDRPRLDLPQRLHWLDTRSMERKLVSGHSPFETVVGYSRAVRDGRHVHVAGTAPIPVQGEPPESAYEQARLCLEIVAGALAEAGAALDDVVRTRIYLVRADDWQEVARAHGEVFGSIRPASTAVVVAGLLDERWLVEIEAEALLPVG